MIPVWDLCEVIWPFSWILRLARTARRLWRRWRKQCGCVCHIPGILRRSEDGAMEECYSCDALGLCDWRIEETIEETIAKHLRARFAKLGR